MWYVKTKHLSEWWRRGVYLSECIPCASWVNVSEKPHKTTGSERASTAQKEPSESLRWEKSMSILSKKKMVFLQWALQGQSNFILCPSSPACKWKTTWFRLKKGAGTWPLAAPVWNPWADPNDPLSGFPVNYVRLLWFWSIPKLILCQIRKTDGEKKSQSGMGCKSHLWRWKAATWPHCGDSVASLPKAWERRRWASGRRSVKLSRTVTVMTSDWEKKGEEKVNMWALNFVYKAYKQMIFSVF